MNKISFNYIKKIFILIAFIFTSGLCAYSKTITKEIEVQTKDNKIIKAEISYAKIEGLKKYSTVVLLHSLGYSSKEWGNLITDLNTAGYAVVAIDLRGHGKSVYDTKFKKKSWSYFTTKDYKKYPSDVLAVLDQAQKQVKAINMNNMAIVGADIGANTAIIVARELKVKPRTLVLISPTMNFKGLYVPIDLVEMGGVPVLSMVSKKDKYSVQQQLQLAKFAQGGFYAKNYPDGGMGMILVKVNPTASQDITRWVLKYLK